MRLIFAALAACFAVPAGADEAYDVHVAWFDVDPTPDRIGVVTWRNTGTPPWAPEIVTLATPRGEVVIHIESTPNDGSGCCADVATVWSAPPNVIVRPSWVQIEEGAAVTFDVLEWEGM